MEVFVWIAPFASGAKSFSHSVEGPYYGVSQKLDIINGLNQLNILFNQLIMINGLCNTNGVTLSELCGTSQTLGALATPGTRG